MHDVPPLSEPDEPRTARHGASPPRTREPLPPRPETQPPRAEDRGGHSPARSGEQHVERVVDERAVVRRDHRRVGSAAPLVGGGRQPRRPRPRTHHTTTRPQRRTPAIRRASNFRNVTARAIWNCRQVCATVRPDLHSQDPFGDGAKSTAEPSCELGSDKTLGLAGGFRLCAATSAQLLRCAGLQSKSSWATWPAAAPPCPYLVRGLDAVSPHVAREDRPRPERRRCLA